MVLIILATLLILGIAFFQSLQGIYSALIMTILTVVCAVFALGTYEPLAEDWLYTRQPAYADAIMLVALFALPLIVLRIIADLTLRRNVVLGIWADRIGGGALGLVTGMTLIGMLTLALQMLPLGPGVITYWPFDHSLQRNQRLWPFRPDEFVLGLYNTVAAGGFSGGYDLSEQHDNLAMELFCARNDAGLGGSREARVRSMRVDQSWEAEPGRDSWVENVPEYPPLKSTEITKIFVVRAKVDSNARGPNNWWRLVGTQFRLITKSGNSYYPVAYLTYAPRTETGSPWKCIVAEDESGRATPRNVADLVAERSSTAQTETVDERGRLRSEPKTLDALEVDWVYRIPRNEVPYELVFRRVARAEIGKPGDPPPRPALTQGRARRGGRAGRRR